MPSRWDFIEVMEKAPAFAVDEGGSGVVHFGGDGGGMKCSMGRSLSVLRASLMPAMRPKLRTAGPAAAAGVFHFETAGEALGEPEGIIDEAGLDADVEGDLVGGFVHGFGVIEHGDGVADAGIESGRGLRRRGCGRR